MSELPTPVSESTSVEIVRLEGRSHSHKSVSTILAGNILVTNASGALQTVGTEGTWAIVGVALYGAVSGARVDVIKGWVRALWDGTGTASDGALIYGSTTYSGMFSATAVSGQANAIGRVHLQPGGVSLAAANSGLVSPVEIW
jgi:hypothetical protein